MNHRNVAMRIVWKNDVPPDHELKLYDGPIENYWTVEGMQKRERKDYEPEYNGVFYLVHYKMDRPEANLERDNLIDLFRKLKFKIFCTQDESTEVFYKHINALKTQHFISAPHCFVYCHLGYGVTRTRALMYDRQMRSVHDIIEMFNNIHCPFLFKKRKVFLFPSCNPQRMALRIDSGPALSAYNPPIARESNAATGTNNYIRMDRKYPSFTDITYFFLEHDEETNSYLKSIRKFCEIVSLYAATETLESMLKLYHNSCGRASHSQYREVSDYGVFEDFNFCMVDDSEEVVNNN